MLILIIDFEEDGYNPREAPFSVWDLRSLVEYIYFVGDYFVFLQYVFRFDLPSLRKQKFIRKGLEDPKTSR